MTAPPGQFMALQVFIVLKETISGYGKVSSGSRGRGGHAPPPRPCKNVIKEDGHQRRPYRFHVSRPPLTWPLDPVLGKVNDLLIYTTKQIGVDVQFCGPEVNA